MTEKKPKVNSEGQKELDKAAENFQAFENSVKDLTLDRMNAAPKQEMEPRTNLSQKDLDKSPDFYLKPERMIGSREKFNEKWRSDYEFAKEYVQFIAEHNEIKGETIEIWTKAFPGAPAEFWKVPVGKPVWGPRYLAEQIKKKCYHRLQTDNRIISADGHGSYFGSMVVDTTIQRLDARPVSSRRSIFMGAASGF